jgi:predicted Zn-dependent peptidase
VTETIFSHVYPNGMVLVAEPNASLESAAFTFLVPAGCAYEPVSRSGLGALACEMTLRGSGARDSRQFTQDLDNLGVERGDSVSTSHTSFGGATLAGNLYPALSIFADQIRRPHFPADQLEPSRLVVLQELRAIEDEPAQKVMLELRRHQYPDPWGRSSHGDAAAIAGVELAHVREFFAGHYRPNGTILGVAGRFDWGRLTDEVGRLFGDWPARDVAEPASGRVLPRHEHLAHESNQTQIGIGFDSLPYSHEDYFQAWGAVGVLSGGMSSRLFTEVREKRGLCYSVYATMHTLRHRGSVLCYAGTSADRAQETLDVTLGELVRLAQGVRPDELARLKARIKSSLIMQQESSSSRSGSIARDWYYLGRARTLEEVGAIVDALTCETINAYLAANPPRDFTVITLGPKPLEVSVGVS